MNIQRVHTYRHARRQSVLEVENLLVNSCASRVFRLRYVLRRRILHNRTHVPELAAQDPAGEAADAALEALFVSFKGVSLYL